MIYDGGFDLDLFRKLPETRVGQRQHNASVSDLGRLPDLVAITLKKLDGRKMILKALIFDVDGTLAETEEVHLHVYNKIFKQAGLDWQWTREKFIRLLSHAGAKEQMRAYSDEVGQGLSDTEISILHDQKMASYEETLRAGGALSLRPGVHDLIRDARDNDLKLGVATASHRKNVETLCQACWGQQADQIFDGVATGDEVLSKKPSPEVYQLALKRLGVSPETTIAIEDSQNGIRSAKAAGMRVLITPSEFSNLDDLSDGDWIVPSLERDDLPGVVLKSLGMRPALSYIERMLAGD